VSEVSVCWLSGGEAFISPDPGLAHNDDVFSLSEWFSAEVDWLKENLGVVG